ncbi:unknown [Bacteroides sp. CAG:1060]|nr:unknown [Bacteroides sp. CAG:1060]
MMFRSECLRYIKHICVRIDRCRFDKSLAADIGYHQVQCPSARKFPAVDFQVFLERSSSDAPVILSVNICV